MGRNFTGLQIADHNALRMAIHHDKVEHFGFREHFHRAGGDLMAQAGVGPEQELLASLAAGVKSPRDLGTTKGTIVEQSAVFAGEGHALRDALIDDRSAHLGEAVDIRFTRAEVAALDGVVEKPVNAVAVVLVILCGVDAALRRDRVGAAWAVLVAEALHIVALLGKRRRGGSPRESRSHDDQIELPLVRGADDFCVVFKSRPLLVERTGWNFAVECHWRTPFPRPKK